MCADTSALKDSVKALSDPDTLTGGKSTIKAALDQVQHDLDALRSSAKASLKPQVDAVKRAVDQLQTAVQGFGNGSFSSSIQKASDAISKVGSTSGDLASALADQCPSS